MNTQPGRNLNVQKWVSALKSGTYKQGKGRLCRVTPEGKEYCCLGVACDLYIKEGNELHTEPDKYAPEFIAYGKYHSVAGVPDEVRAWLGLRETLGQFGERALAWMNDEGASFSEIAEVIESKPTGLFA